MNENTDRAVEQSLAEVALQRVRLPGFYNSLAAQLMNEHSPGEFDAEQVGIDQNGQGVYVMFWRTPQRAQA